MYQLLSSLLVLKTSQPHPYIIQLCITNMTYNYGCWNFKMCDGNYTGRADQSTSVIALITVWVLCHLQLPTPLRLVDANYLLAYLLSINELQAHSTNADMNLEYSHTAKVCWSDILSKHLLWNTSLDYLGVWRHCTLPGNSSSPAWGSLPCTAGAPAVALWRHRSRSRRPHTEEMWYSSKLGWYTVYRPRTGCVTPSVTQTQL